MAITSSQNMQGALAMNETLATLSLTPTLCHGAIRQLASAVEADD